MRLARRICGWIFCLPRSSRGCANCSVNISTRGLAPTRRCCNATLPTRNSRAPRPFRNRFGRAVTAGQNDSTHHIVRILLAPLNEMTDATIARAIARDTHLPALIFLLLICVALLSALLAGQVMAKRKHRSALHMILYAAIISVTIYAVLDLDEPRSGWIRLDRTDQALIELRDSIR
jgi:hypothetical protein